MSRDLRQRADAYARSQITENDMRPSDLVLCHMLIAAYLVGYRDATKQAVSASARAREDVARLKKTMFGKAGT